jgi:hypothetical protein
MPASSTSDTAPENLANTRGDLAERLVPVAADLVLRVRDEGRDAIGHLLATLTPEERWALPVVLAAMVPPGLPVGDLLAWVTWDEHGHPLTLPAHLPPRRPSAGLRPCGTHAAFARHKAHGEPPCAVCTDAERAYQARRRNAA